MPEADRAPSNRSLSPPLAADCVDECARRILAACRARLPDLSSHLIVLPSPGAGAGAAPGPGRGRRAPCCCRASPPWPSWRPAGQCRRQPDSQRQLALYRRVARAGLVRRQRAVGDLRRTDRALRRVERARIGLPADENELSWSVSSGPTTSRGSQFCASRPKWCIACGGPRLAGPPGRHAAQAMAWRNWPRRRRPPVHAVEGEAAAGRGGVLPSLGGAAAGDGFPAAARRGRLALDAGAQPSPGRPAPARRRRWPPRAARRGAAGQPAGGPLAADRRGQPRGGGRGRRCRGAALAGGRPPAHRPGGGRPRGGAARAGPARARRHPGAGRDRLETVHHAGGGPGRRLAGSGGGRRLSPRSARPRQIPLRLRGPGRRRLGARPACCSWKTAWRATTWPMAWAAARRVLARGRLWRGGRPAQRVGAARRAMPRGAPPAATGWPGWSGRWTNWAPCRSCGRMRRGRPCSSCCACGARSSPPCHSD
jgi:hypothetical protein